jgi:hypothetical protein
VTSSGVKRSRERRWTLSELIPVNRQWITAMIRRYSELKRLETLKERFDYLKLHGRVGQATFGFDRYMNQQFYTSREWRRCRTDVIARDLGCVLGVDGYEIHKGLYIHHMNPLSREDIVAGGDNMFDPEYLITVTHQTHNAIHYGDERLLPRPLVERRAGDTKLW